MVRGLLWALLAAAPLFLWMGYVRWQIEGSAEAGSRNFTWPVTGLLNKWDDCLAAMTDPRVSQNA